MDKINMIKDVNGFSYFYSNAHKMFSFIPSDAKNSEAESDYSKYDFLKQHDYFAEPAIDFVIDSDPEKIKMNLANLRQLLIEVTDACNIQCRYCAYGELYTNFDKRSAKQQQFSNVKQSISSRCTKVTQKN